MFVENDLKKMDKNDKFYLNQCPKNQETYYFFTKKSRKTEGFVQKLKPKTLISGIFKKMDLSKVH